MRGGGSMDITSTLHSPRHRTFSAAGLLSILSRTSLISSISNAAPGSGSERWRTSSSTLGSSTSSPASAIFGGSISLNVLGLDVSNSGDEEINPEDFEDNQQCWLLIFLENRRVIHTLPNFQITFLLLKANL